MLLYSTSGFVSHQWLAFFEYTSFPTFESRVLVQITLGVLLFLSLCLCSHSIQQFLYQAAFFYNIQLLDFSTQVTSIRARYLLLSLTSFFPAHYDHFVG